MESGVRKRNGQTVIVHHMIIWVVQREVSHFVSESESEV